MSMSHSFPGVGRSSNRLDSLKQISVYYSHEQKSLLTFNPYQKAITGAHQLAFPISQFPRYTTVAGGAFILFDRMESVLIQESQIKANEIFN